MKVLYELGRLASHQAYRTAFPDPDGLRVLLRRGLARQASTIGHYELTPKGAKLAERIAKVILRES